MGLRVQIYRSDYDSTINAFYGKKAITVVNIDGPSDPTPDAPAAVLVRRSAPYGDYIAPADVPSDKTHATNMNGGTIADSSDSRWREAAGGPLPIHDRHETWAQYGVMSR